MGATYFYGTLLLSCLLVRQSDSNSTLDKEKTLSWVAPRELQVRFPYYFTGYDDDGSPVYMGEFGKWNYIDELAKGPENEEMLRKLCTQIYLRLVQEGAEAEGGVGSVIVADFKDFKTDSRVVKFFENLFLIFGEVNRTPGLKKCYVTNANKDYVDIVEKIKTNLAHLKERFHVYGEDATKWSPEVLKYLEVDQTRFGAGSEPVAPLKEALDRKIPQDVAEPYEYYWAGYSKRGQPVFIIPFGEWNFRAVVEKGPRAMLKFGRLHDHMVFVINHEGIEAPGSPGSILIMDSKGYDKRQASHNETANFYVNLLKRADIISRSSGIAHIYVINSNPEWEKLYNISKPNLKTLGDSVDVFGEDSKEWEPVLLNEISPDQLPEKYGGAKGYSPLKVYNSV